MTNKLLFNSVIIQFSYIFRGLLIVFYYTWLFVFLKWLFQFKYMYKFNWSGKNYFGEDETGTRRGKNKKVVLKSAIKLLETVRIANPRNLYCKIPRYVI